MMVGEESCSFTRPRGFFDGFVPGRPFPNLENSSSIILVAPGGALTARRARKSSRFEGPPADWKLRIQLRKRSRGMTHEHHGASSKTAFEKKTTPKEFMR